MKWKDILVSKYGLKLGRSQSNVNFQSWWWRDLCKVCGDGEDQGWFQEALVGKVGSGDIIRFWEDAWVGNSKIVNLYPRLYSLSKDQRKKVGEVEVWEDLGWQWRLRWRRVRFVWESTQEEDMLRYIYRGALNREEMDIQLWKRDSTGDFSVKSAYECDSCRFAV